MVLVPVTCPYCHSDQVIKGGKTETGNIAIAANGLTALPGPSCSLRPTKYKGRFPQLKGQVLAMALNGSGIRDTARVLQISSTTVMNELHKKHRRQQCEPPSPGLVEPGGGSLGRCGGGSSD